MPTVQTNHRRQEVREEGRVPAAIQTARIHPRRNLFHFCGARGLLARRRVRCDSADIELLTARSPSPTTPRLITFVSDACRA